MIYLLVFLVVEETCPKRIHNIFFNLWFQTLNRTILVLQIYLLVCKHATWHTAFRAILFNCVVGWHVACELCRRATRMWFKSKLLVLARIHLNIDWLWVIIIFIRTVVICSEMMVCILDVSIHVHFEFSLYMLFTL